jgi:hypothetical protein
VTYKLLADTVVLVHLGWIVFLFIGSIWGKKYKAVRILHLGGLSFAVISEIFGWICPITHLEAWLRAKHDPALTYTGSFIAHYAEELIYTEVSRTAVLVCTVILVAFNLWIYFKKPKD